MTLQIRSKPVFPKLQMGHPLARGLVVAFLLDEQGGTTIYDATGTQDNGTLQGGPTVSNYGFGSAWKFNGTSDLFWILDSPQLTLGATGSVVATFMPTTLDSTTRTIARKGNTTGVALEWLFRVSATNTLAGGFCNGSIVPLATGATTLLANRTYCGALTYDGAVNRVFLDGALDGTSTAITGNIFDGTDVMTIGAAPDNGGGPVAGPTQFFGGAIGSVYVYNRCLTLDENAWIGENPFAMFRGHRILKPAAAVSTVFRRTRSPLGTRTGSRQVAA